MIVQVLLSNNLTPYHTKTIVVSNFTQRAGNTRDSSVSGDNGFVPPNLSTGVKKTNTKLIHKYKKYKNVYRGLHKNK